MWSSCHSDCSCCFYSVVVAVVVDVVVVVVVDVVVAVVADVVVDVFGCQGLPRSCCG